MEFEDLLVVFENSINKRPYRDIHVSIKIYALRSKLNQTIFRICNISYSFDFVLLYNFDKSTTQNINSNILNNTFKRSKNVIRWINCCLSLF